MKVLFRQLTPPVLLELHRTLRKRHIWKGVYPHFRDVPAIGPGYSGQPWRTSAVAYTRKILAVSQGKQIAGDPTPADEEDALLSMVAAIVRCQNGGTLRVLDFGGGVGVSYAFLLGNLVDHSGLEYHVVDLEWAAQEGPRLFAGDQRIHFHTSLPDNLPNVDIVYMNSALEWIEDYLGLLTRLCAYDASYFLFTNFRAGAFPTHASALRLIPGSTIPTWFLNIDEMVGIMTKGGYSLQFNGLSGATFNQRNFPEHLRLAGGQSRVLLFARSNRGHETDFHNAVGSG